MGIKNILPVILSSVPFAPLCVVYKSSNLKREERGYQFASMFLGLLYTIAAISYSDKLSDQILSKLKYWVAKFMILAEQKPQFATAFRRIADFINTVNWEIYMIFIINFLALAAFMIIKRALLRLCLNLFGKMKICLMPLRAFAMNGAMRAAHMCSSLSAFRSGQ